MLYQSGLPADVGGGHILTVIGDKGAAAALWPGGHMLTGIGGGYSQAAETSAGGLRAGLMAETSATYQGYAGGGDGDVGCQAYLPEA